MKSSGQLRGRDLADEWRAPRHLRWARRFCRPAILLGMTQATFRFYEELNDFLPAERRRQSFTCECAQGATVKHMIEALGIPHTEVELVLLNGESVGLDHVLDRRPSRALAGE